MEQDVVRSARRRRVHDLQSDPALRHESHQIELRPHQRIPGTEDNDVGSRRQRRFQVAERQFLRGRRLPVANESIGRNDEMGANPVFSDSHTALLPGGNMVRFRGFPGELDDPLRWCVAGDYTRPRDASNVPAQARQVARAAARDSCHGLLADT